MSITRCHLCAKVNSRFDAFSVLKLKHEIHDFDQFKKRKVDCIYNTETQLKYTLREEIFRGRNFYGRNFCGIYFCDFDPYSQKFLPQKYFKIDQSQKFLPQNFVKIDQSQKFIPQKFSNDAILNSMAYRYFLLKNKTHFAMIQVNFLSL